MSKPTFINNTGINYSQIPLSQMPLISQSVRQSVHRRSFLRDVCTDFIDIWYHDQVLWVPGTHQI